MPVSIIKQWYNKAMLHRKCTQILVMGLSNYLNMKRQTFLNFDHTSQFAKFNELQHIGALPAWKENKKLEVESVCFHSFKRNN